MQVHRQHSDAVFLALASSDINLVAFEVNVFDAQSQAFDTTQTGAIYDFDNELVNA